MLNYLYLTILAISLIGLSGCAMVVGRRPQPLGAEVHCILCVEINTKDDPHGKGGFGLVWYP